MYHIRGAGEQLGPKIRPPARTSAHPQNQPEITAPNSNF